ncbi:MAG: hypothetical protein WCT05_02320, partial [Lentisphaeria bacterium]
LLRLSLLLLRLSLLLLRLSLLLLRLSLLLLRLSLLLLRLSLGYKKKVINRLLTGVMLHLCVICLILTI